MRSRESGESGLTEGGHGDRARLFRDETIMTGSSAPCTIVCTSKYLLHTAVNSAVSVGTLPHLNIAPHARSAFLSLVCVFLVLCPPPWFACFFCFSRRPPCVNADGGCRAAQTDKDSKLCNVFFTLEAQRRLAARKSGVKVDCFSPGLIPSSGLFRNQNPIFSKIFDFAATNIIKASKRPCFFLFVFVCRSKRQGSKAL